MLHYEEVGKRTFPTIILPALLITLSFLLFRTPRPESIYEPPVELVPRVPEIIQEKQNIKLIIVGDIMLDRHIRMFAEGRGYDFILSDIAEFLRSADLVLGNLEGPITKYPSVSVGSEIGSPNNYIFTFDPETADFLYSNNIRLVNLGNNHILNFGNQGLADTLSYLNQSGISYFGSIKGDYVDTSIIVDLADLRIGFVNYNEFYEGSFEEAIDAISEINDVVDVLVVYTHWGSEYVSVANSGIQTLAHSFIDSGADLVVGSHPHVVQQSEEYKGKKIYYSLGNFIFDQYFSEETMKGLLLEVEINPSDFSLKTTEHKVQLTSEGMTLMLAD